METVPSITISKGGSPVVADVVNYTAIPNAPKPFPINHSVQGDGLPTPHDY
jgi:hypothetical protein